MVQTSKKQFAVVSEDYGPDLHKYSLNHKDNWMYERYIKRQNECYEDIKSELYIIVFIYFLVLFMDMENS